MKDQIRVQPVNLYRSMAHSEFYFNEDMGLNLHPETFAGVAEDFHWWTTIRALRITTKALDTVFGSKIHAANISRP